MQTFDTASQTKYASSVAETKATRIGVLFGAAISRTVFALRLFCRLGFPSFGRPGGRERKLHRCSNGTPTPARVALPIGVGLAGTYRNWSNTMSNTNPRFNDASTRLYCASEMLLFMSIALRSGDNDRPSDDVISASLHGVSLMVSDAYYRLNEVSK